MTVTVAMVMVSMVTMGVNNSLRHLTPGPDRPGGEKDRPPAPKLALHGDPPVEQRDRDPERDGEMVGTLELGDLRVRC